LSFSIVSALKLRATMLETHPPPHRAWNGNGSSISQAVTATAAVPWTSRSPGRPFITARIPSTPFELQGAA
jgi:hypothetical protein